VVIVSDTVVPVVSADQASLTVVESAAVTLSCAVTGDPLPVLAWTRSGSPVVTGSRYRISTDGWSLAISDVQTEDEGVYQCAGTNPGGSSSDTITVNVIGKLQAM